MAKQVHKVLLLSYGDMKAQLLLWQKAFLLVPIWGLVAIPLAGFVFRQFGKGGQEVGYALMLALCVNYFLVDLLRKKIRVDDDYIYFGYRKAAIRDFVGADISYRKGKLLPSYIMLRSATGDDLKLNLNGLSERDISSLLKHLETRNSSLQVTPVLGTLIKCRQAKPKLSLQVSDRLYLPYNSKKVFNESYEVFKSSASHWVRVGPVLASIICAPMWLSFYSSLFTMLSSNSWETLSKMNTHQTLTKLTEVNSHFIQQSLTSSTEAVGHVAQNPITMVFCAIAIFLFALYFQSMIWKPNRMIADNTSLQLWLMIGGLKFPMRKVAWKEIKRASLFKPKNSSGSQSWKIRLEKIDGRNFDIDLSALYHDDRAMLLKRLEKMVPDCQIDYELSQSMRPHAAQSYTEIWLQSLNQAPERKTLDPLQPGQVVGDGRFEVLRSIGVGGQGTAYLCREVNDKTKTVVLKETIIPVFGDESVRRKALESVEKETRLLNSLNNPHIVKLIDHFIEDHRSYLVLEHIDGESLRSKVESHGALTHEEAYDLSLQMCDMLKVLHANGVVHRDFTPDNLILNSKGQLKLIDFNVAQQVQGGATGTIVGKHAYLPPEQFRGKATSQSDLYAFGATLFFMLTGQDPEPITQSAPHSVNEKIDANFNQIVKKATALQAVNRYDTADSIASELLAMSHAGASEHGNNGHKAEGTLKLTPDPRDAEEKQPPQTDELELVDDKEGQKIFLNTSEKLKVAEHG